MLKTLLWQRLLWWLAGLAMPLRPVLIFRLRQGLTALICAVIGGVLLGGLLLASIGGIYVLLLQQGSHPLTAFIGLGIVVMMAGGALLWHAYRQVLVIANLREDLQGRPDVAVQQAEREVQSLFSAFLEGMMTPAAEYPAAMAEPVPRRARVTPHQVDLTATVAPAAGAITRPVTHTPSSSTH
jgi:hypothetical protein